MKAMKKLVLLTLTLLLISAVAYSLWLPGVLEYEAGKLERPPSGISITNAILGYFVFLSLCASSSGPVGPAILVLLGSVWVRYFYKFHEDYLKEKRRSGTSTQV